MKYKITVIYGMHTWTAYEVDGIDEAKKSIEKYRKNQVRYTNRLGLTPTAISVVEKNVIDRLLYAWSSRENPVMPALV